MHCFLSSFHSITLRCPVAVPPQFFFQVLPVLYSAVLAPLRASPTEARWTILHDADPKNTSKMSSRRASNADRQCRVCGMPNADMNFGAEVTFDYCSLSGEVSTNTETSSLCSRTGASRSLSAQSSRKHLWNEKNMRVH